MKRRIHIIALFLITYYSAQSQTTDRIGLSGPIEFSKTKFSLAWSEKPNENYFVQEYLPKRETLEKFNQLITVNVFVVNIGVEEAINQKVSELTKRKETDRVCRFKMINSKDDKEKMLECLLGSEKIDIVEFIIYRYTQIELENNKKALLVYSYSTRGYGEDVASFMERLKVKRNDLINEMSSMKMPDIIIKE